MMTVSHKSAASAAVLLRLGSIVIFATNSTPRPGCTLMSSAFPLIPRLVDTTANVIIASHNRREENDDNGHHEEGRRRRRQQRPTLRVSLLLTPLPAALSSSSSSSSLSLLSPSSSSSSSSSTSSSLKQNVLGGKKVQGNDNNTASRSGTVVATFLVNKSHSEDATTTPDRSRTPDHHPTTTIDAMKVETTSGGIFRPGPNDGMLVVTTTWMRVERWIKRRWAILFFGTLSGAVGWYCFHGSIDILPFIPSLQNTPIILKDWSSILSILAYISFFFITSFMFVDMQDDTIMLETTIRKEDWARKERYRLEDKIADLQREKRQIFVLPWDKKRIDDEIQLAKQRLEKLQKG